MAEHDDHTHDHAHDHAHDHTQDHAHHDGDAAHWWYNHKTGEVEHGPQSLGSDRDGPYATEADARRGPEIARERARAWAADEEE